MLQVAARARRAAVDVIAAAHSLRKDSEGRNSKHFLNLFNNFAS